MISSTPKWIQMPLPKLKVTTTGTDTALMVAIDANQTIGPAQTSYRYLYFDDYDQTSKSDIKTASKIIQKDKETRLENVPFHENCTSHYKFGFVSLIANIGHCYIDTSLTTNLSYSYNAKIGDDLVAVKFINGTLETKTVRVVDLDECISVIDPNYTYALEEEQFCTESPFGAPEAMKMPDSLLFIAKDDAHLAGITTKANEIFARTTFKFAILDPKHYGKIESIVEGEDRVLLVAVNESTVVGPSQIKLRYVKSEIDQLADSNVTNLSELIKNRSKLLKFNSTTDLVSLHPNFGHFTLVYNVAKIILFSEPFVDKNFPVISKNLIIRPNDKLIAVKFINGKLEFEKISVINFHFCIDKFDPEKRFLIDSEEQFCIESIFLDFENIFPNILLFAIRDQIYLVGTVTKMTEFVGLASFVPKSCEEFFDVGETKLCQ